MKAKTQSDYLVIRWEFTLQKLPQLRKSSLCDSAIKWNFFLFQNNLQDLNPSYMMDLDVLEIFEEKTPIL